VQKPAYHFFLCNSFRVQGDPQGACNRKGSAELLQYLQTEIGDRGLDAMVSTTSCMNVCEKGPVLVVYPMAWWYHGVTEEKVDEILDALEEGQPVETLLIPGTT
jgi:(2Fe-2S) ferredoxin